jgi:hypothetical protein
MDCIHGIVSYNDTYGYYAHLRNGVTPILIEDKFFKKLKSCCRLDRHDIAFSIGKEDIGDVSVQVLVIVNQYDEFVRKEAWSYLKDRMDAAKTLLDYCPDWEQVVIERPQLDYWWLYVSERTKYPTNTQGFIESH